MDARTGHRGNAVVVVFFYTNDGDVFCVVLFTGGSWPSFRFFAHSLPSGYSRTFLESIFFQFADLVDRKSKLVNENYNCYVLKVYAALKADLIFVILRKGVFVCRSPLFLSIFKTLDHLLEVDGYTAPCTVACSLFGNKKLYAL